MNYRTADGFEVRDGDRVWVSGTETGIVSSGGWDVRTPTDPRDGISSQIGLVRTSYTTRLAALRAARDRAAGEVERLEAEIEIEKEKGNG